MKTASLVQLDFMDALFRPAAPVAKPCSGSVETRGCPARGARAPSPSGVTDAPAAVRLVAGTSVTPTRRRDQSDDGTGIGEDDLRQPAGTDASTGADVGGGMAVGGFTGMGGTGGDGATGEGSGKAADGAAMAVPAIAGPMAGGEDHVGEAFAVTAVTAVTATATTAAMAGPETDSVAQGDPARGIPGEASAVVAGRWWGCSRDAVVRMVQLGYLTGGSRAVGSREHWHVVVDDWGVPLRDRFLAWLASDPPLPDVPAFRRFDDVRVLSGCEDVPVTNHWIASYDALPDRYVGHDYPQEIRSVLTASDEEVSRISRTLQLMGDDGRVYADRVAIPDGEIRAMLLAALSPDVPELSFTWLGEGGERLEPIDPVACARLLSIPPGRRRDRAIVHAASATANAEMIQTSVQALSHARAAMLLAEVADDDHAGIEAAWTSFLNGEAMPTVGRAAIVRTIHDELACERTFWAYHDEPVGQELKLWLANAAPYIPDSDDFLDLVRDKVEFSAAAGDAKRKGRSDVISDSFDDHAAEAEAALAEAKAMRMWIGKGHAAAKSSEAFTFSFPMPILGEGRRDTGATMMVDMVSVRADAFLKELVAGAKARGEELTAKSFLRRHAPGGDRYDASFAKRRFAIYVGCESDDPDVPACEPSMMAAYRVGAALPPGMLLDATIVERRAHFARTGMPIPTLRPKGLVCGDPFETNVMVWALRAGLIVYPEDAFAQAASTGALFWRMSVANQGRGGTAIQLVDDRAGFGKAPDETGRKRPFYWGIPKLGEGVPRPQPLDDDTPKAFKAHIALTLEIEGHGGRPEAERKRLAEVEPSADHPAACGRARYGFQARGRAQTVGNVSYCLSWTFGRLVLSHDPRHSGANRREQEGASPREVADGIGNSSITVSSKYSRPTAAQVKAMGGGKFISIRDALAKLGTGSIL